MNIQSILKLKPILKPYELRYNSSTSKFQKSVQVCILGASTRLGTYTSFLMKQNPLVSSLHLQGCFPIEKIGKDLNYFDTRCHVNTYAGLEKGVSKAIKSADIVLILPCEETKSNVTIGEQIMAEGRRVYNIAAQCTVFAPRAILVVAVPPVSVTMPLVSEVFKKTNFYHPGRIIGSAAFAQMKSNTLLGRFQDLDPQNCYAPIVGGPDIELAVPLYSMAKPVEVFGKDGPRTLTAQFRGVKKDDLPKSFGVPNQNIHCELAESYALNQLISAIALGLCGDQLSAANVFIRSNILPTCKGGAVHNFGIPHLSRFELELLEKAALELAQREQMALDYQEYLENHGKNCEPPPFSIKEKQDKDLLKQKVIR
ncbi:malate dehydrogenase, mitochondrial-like isoform X2 [Anthonomus grandis grandis]|uniref:malate dehydrogenase, mitochondrial-like isoform X2 n=1 Tax=Anthonomus grandis grandis TaxID=2921223 RepID=UPI0021667FFD|nr:malate dehydrogenase, mitochondrial-like isoform X2 [Anthonomus grandis grandis]